MLKHEKIAFWQFFVIYFGSVALLILALGFFYFAEQKKQLIQKEHFSMIEYTRQLKMNLNPKSQHISHTLLDIEIDNFNMNNFAISDSNFSKYMPMSWEGGYILVTKDKQSYYEELSVIKLRIVLVQILLLVLFGIISYFLALRALQPMKDAITKLDNFSKDFIHDLNTPITSMFLNMKILETQSEFTQNKPLKRIKQSLEDIGKLHDNLIVLLQEDTLIMQEESIFEIVDEVVFTHKKLYTNLEFIVEKQYVFANINRDAFKQIMVNLLSNACKYNRADGWIKIYFKNNQLFIEDNGLGIQNPKNIFERSYKEHGQGYGIGLHIVKRLCDAMAINIEVHSQIELGTTVTLRFKD